ncbi:MAG: AI-2E family transporter [bacterium]
MPAILELTKRVEMIAGLALLALVTAGCLLVVAPFVSSILWAAIICFATWPLYQHVVRLCGPRRSLSAAIMTTLVVVLTVLPFVLTASVLDESISALLVRVQTVSTQGFPTPQPWIGSIPVVGTDLHAYWNSLVADSEKGHTFLKMILDHSKTWLFLFGMKFGVGVLHLCLSMFIAFFFYRDGDRLVARIAEIGKHVLGEYSQHLVGVVGRTVRGVVYGFLGTALVQGVLAAIGFYIVGAPCALLLGLLTFFLALVPMGPPLIWIPVTVWLVANQHFGMAIFMGVWGAIAISGIDHFLRPYLISRESQLPFVLVFLGAMGGILVFGFIGIFLGPTLLAVGYALLHEFLTRKNTVVTPGADTGAV